MKKIRIESIDARLMGSPQALHHAHLLLARAQAMGFCSPGVLERPCLDAALLSDVARCLQEAGVASEAAAVLRARAESGEVEGLAGSLEALVRAADESPMPESEWRPAREVVGDDLLARLVGISQSSLRRYAAGVRETPDDTAWRLHIVARILASLLGSYNGYGVRRWFERRRKALGGLSPADVVTAATDEDDGLLQTVVSLADDLVGPGSAT